MRYLLSIDGGGIRGIIPALALLKLEQTTNRLSRDTFSFVAGTSTGALMAAAIAAGLPAERIVNLYKNRTKDIFTPGRPFSDLKRAATGHKYGAANIHKVLVDEFGAAAAWKLNDSPIDILLTATALDANPWYFVKDNPNNARTTGNLLLVDCATASAAAPTYFDPWPMPAPVGENVVDGGVGVTGNPVYQACVEAFCYGVGYQPEQATVISFGTGRYASKQNPRLLTQWLGWVLDTLLHAPEEQQTGIVARHYPQSVLYRLEADLPSNIDMDNLGGIPLLEQIGEQFAARVDWAAMLRGDKTEFSVKA